MALTDPVKKAQVDQYVSVVNRFETGVQAEVAGNFTAAAGVLAGVGSEFGQLNSGLQAMCSP